MFVQMPTALSGLSNHIPAPQTPYLLNDVSSAIHITSNGIFLEYRLSKSTYIIKNKFNFWDLFCVSSVNLSMLHQYRRLQQTVFKLQSAKEKDKLKFLLFVLLLRSRAKQKTPRPKSRPHSSNNNNKTGPNLLIFI